MYYGKPHTRLLPPRIAHLQPRKAPGQASNCARTASWLLAFQVRLTARFARESGPAAPGEVQPYRAISARSLSSVSPRAPADNRRIRQRGAQHWPAGSGRARRPRTLSVHLLSWGKLALRFLIHVPREQLAEARKGVRQSRFNRTNRDAYGFAIRPLR